MQGTGNSQWWLIAMLVALFAVAATADDSASKEILPQSGEKQESASLIIRESSVAGIEHVFQLTSRIWSGGEPKEAAAFDQLADLGVQTIISVDSAKPNVAAAKKLGIRYIHIPTRYEGLDRETQLRIFRAVKESRGGIFFHCHHGKHRGPAAAAIGCIAEESATPTEALRILADAGTSTEYDGLWESVRKFQPPSKDETLPPLVSSADTNPVGMSMARIDRLWTRIQEEQSAEPKRSTKNLVDSTLLLSEEFRELARVDLSDYDKEFRDLLTESARLATQMHQQAKAPGRLSPKLVSSLKQQCQNCHSEWR